MNRPGSRSRDAIANEALPFAGDLKGKLALTLGSLCGRTGLAGCQRETQSGFSRECNTRSPRNWSEFLKPDKGAGNYWLSGAISVILS